MSSLQRSPTTRPRLAGVAPGLRLIIAYKLARTLWLTAAAIVAAEGATTLLEGWSLLRGFWWGPWLVVFLTGAFVPGELIALARHQSASRVLLLAANVIVVSYLFWRARRHRDPS